MTWPRLTQRGYWTFLACVWLLSGLLQLQAGDLWIAFVDLATGLGCLGIARTWFRV